MRIIVTGIFIILTGIVFSGKDVIDLVDPFDQGVLSFEKKKYSEARDNFIASAEVEPNNEAAWYNLGLSYLELKEYGESIWAFEKALKLDPGNDRALEGLTLAKAKLNPAGLVDVDSNPNFFSQLSPDTWAILGVVSSLLTGFLLFLYFNKRSTARGLLIPLAGLFFFFILLTIYGGYSSKEIRSNDKAGIVVQSAKQHLIDLTPSDVDIPEGTKVLIGDTVKTDFIKVFTGNEDEVIIRHEFLKRI